MLDSSTAKLVRALEGASAPDYLVKRAKENAFHDFLSPSPMPIHDLVSECRKVGLHGIAKRAIEGEFDATKPESDEWMRSDDGQRALTMLSDDAELIRAVSRCKRMSTAVRLIAIFRSKRVCRFGCAGEPVGLYRLSRGCVCYPDDREQWLCAQHAVRAEPLGEMERII